MKTSNDELLIGLGMLLTLMGYTSFRIVDKLPDGVRIEEYDGVRCADAGNRKVIIEWPRYEE